MQLDQEIESILSLRQKYHSDFQIDRFVLGSKQTLWGLLKKAMAELDSRWTTLRRERLEERKVETEIEQLKIEIEQKFIALEGLRRTMADREREMVQLVDRAKSARAVIERDNGEITAETRSRIEECDQIERLRFQGCLDLYTLGRLSRPIAEAIYGLSSAQRMEVLSFLKDPTMVEAEIESGPGISLLEESDEVAE